MLHTGICKNKVLTISSEFVIPQKEQDDCKVGTSAGIRVGLAGRRLPPLPTEPTLVRTVGVSSNPLSTFSVDSQNTSSTQQQTSILQYMRTSSR